MPKIRRDLDNFINNVNKLLEQFRITFGESKQYQNAKRNVILVLGDTGLLTRNNGVMKIKRSYTANNLAPVVWQTLADNLRNVNYKQEKKEVMELVRQARRRNGMTQKEVNKRITAREIKEMADFTWQMDTDLREAIDFFYHHRDEPETEQAMTILERKGRRTYSEIGQVLSLARDLQSRLIREGELTEPVLPYTLPNKVTGVPRWDIMKQKGFV